MRHASSSTHLCGTPGLVGAERCKATQRPYVLRYEKLLSDPSGERAKLPLALGLSTHVIEHQAEQSREGKGIPIPEVYREGKTQGWRSLFAEQDVHTFKELAGDLLVALGYERNGDWGLSDWTSGTTCD